MLVRSAVGAMAALVLVIAALVGLWLLAPSLRAALPAPMLARYAFAIAAVAGVGFALSTAFAAVLDQLWQTYASIAIVAAVLFQVPAARIWRSTLGLGGPDTQGGPDLIVLAGATLVALVLMWVAVKLVERRDF